MFDFDENDFGRRDDLDCDCGSEDGGLDYGCEENECCADCEYFPDCDGCGARGPLPEQAPSSAAKRKAKKSSPNAGSLPSGPPSVPPSPKGEKDAGKNGRLVLWIALAVVALLLLIVGANIA